MQGFKCQEHGHNAANCDNTERCSKCGGRHHIKHCNQTEPCCANCTEKQNAAYKGCQKFKKAKQQARAASYAETFEKTSKQIQRKSTNSSKYYQKANTKTEHKKQVMNRHKSRKTSKIH